MALYKYKGYNKSGKEITGVLEAPDLRTAQLNIRAQQILPFHVEPVREKRRFTFSRRADIGYLFFQIGIMLKCGLPLTRAIDVVTTQSGNRRLTSILKEIKKDITEGTRFSEALGRHSGYFPDVYVNMVRIAEATGGLADLLLNIAGYEEQKKEQESKLKSALTYPMIVGLIGSGIVGFLLIYVVPKMLRIFTSVKIELPLSTRMLIAMGGFFRSYGLLLILLLVIVYLLFRRYYFHKEGFKKRIDSLLIRLELYRKAAIARLTEILAFQLQEGIPLVLALKATKGTIKNSILHSEIDRLTAEVEKGKSLSEAIRRSVIFDDMFKAAIITGESTGELTGFLKKISHYMQKDVERVTRRALSLAEPVMILILGLIVGFIVLSIMLPIFDLNQLVR
ncbi:MAG TPA: type II secretion system F family protein [Nitrospirae bacterium]|nr:type II secretion system F family protein [Nitrospirota bacterium]